MSLPRNTQNQSEISPQEEISELWQKVKNMREEDRRAAEDKYQTALLLATVDRLCELLTNYTRDTQKELHEMKEHQLRLLDLQEEYRQSVRKDAAKVLNDNIGIIMKKQNEAVDKMLEHTKTAVTNIETAVDKSAEKLNTASHATWLAWLWYSLAPVAVIVQTVIMVWQHFR